MDLSLSSMLGPRLSLAGAALMGGQQSLGRWADGAYFAYDATRDKGFLNYGRRLVPLTGIPGISITRATTGYALTQQGQLSQFASGAARIGSRGLLVEGAATNLCLQSQTFDNATWVKSSGSVTANSDVAPDGTTTADTINNVAGTGDRITQDVVATSTASHTFSCYLKAGVGGVTTLLLRNSTTATNIAAGTFTLSGAGSVGAVTGSATITRLGSTDWYFCTITSSGGVTSGNTLICYIYAGQSSGSIGSTTIGWGAQLEATAYATSYVPTTAGSATRNADVISIGSVTGLAYPVTLFAEFERAYDSGSFEEHLVIDAGSSANRAVIYTGSSDLATVSCTSSSVNQGTVAVAGSISVGVVQRLAARIQTNDMQAARNGALGSADASVTLPAANPTAIRIGSNSSGGVQSASYLRRLAVFPTAYTNAQLQTLTA